MSVAKLKKHRILIILAVIFGIASVFVVFSIIGKEIEPPFINEVQINNPDYFSNDKVDNEIYTVVDNGYHRVLFLNHDKKVIKQLYFDFNSDLLTYAYLCYSVENDIYVLGLYAAPDKNTNVEIRILKYTRYGEYVSTEYKSEFEPRSTVDVQSVDSTKEGLQVLWSDKNSLFVENISDSSKNMSYSLHTNERVMQAVYNSFDNSYILFTNMAGSILLKNGVLTPIDARAYLKENYNIDLTLDEYLFMIGNCSKIDVGNTELCYSLPEFNCVRSIDINSGESSTYKSFELEPSLIIKNLIIFLAIVYICIFIIVLFVRFIIREKQNDFKNLKNLFIGIGVVLLLITITTFSSTAFYENSKSNLCSEIDSVSNYIKDNFVYKQGQFDKKLFDNKYYTNEQINNNITMIDDMAVQNLNTIRYFFSNNLISSIYIYGYDKDINKLENMFNSFQGELLGSCSLSFNDEHIEKLKKGEILTVESDYDRQNYIFSASPIYNTDSQFVGVFSYAISTNDIDKNALNNFKDQLIIFAIAILAIYLFFMEIINFVKNYVNYKKSKKNKQSHSEVHMIETMDFLRNFAYSIDMVLCVLISKAMLDDLGLSDNGVLIGLPMTAMGVGSLICALLFSKLTKKISVRSLFVIGSVITVVTMIVLSIATAINSFILFTLFKFVFGISFTLIQAGDASLPLCIEDKKLRFKIIRGSSLSEVSSQMLAVVVAAALATIFGNYSIYLFVAVVAVLMLIMSFMIMPKDQKFRNENKNLNNKVSMSYLIRFILSPAIISIIVVYLISFSASAYKSFLFPLLTDNMSISKLDISNYFIIASALVYVFSSGVDKFTKKFDHWHVVLFCLIILGILFIFFMYNDTLLWMIFVFFATVLVHKSLLASISMLWPRKCEKDNIDPAAMQPVFLTIISISSTVRPVILGLLLVFGPTGACVALGGLLVLTAIMFVVFTRKSSIR